MTENEIDLVISPSLNSVPSPYDILMEAIPDIPSEKLEKRYTQTHFSEIIALMVNLAYNKYKLYQKSASNSIITSFLREYYPETQLTDVKDKHTIQEMLETIMPVMVRFEFRASQKRKARAGSTFEYIIELLLKKIDIRCERTSKNIRRKLNRIDIVLPDLETALKRPDKATFLSCKHTLRERWKQTLPEQKRNWRMYLLTMDDINDKKAKEINENGLIVYVKDGIKKQSHLARKEWIRKFSDLPKDLNST